MHMSKNTLVAFFTVVALIAFGGGYTLSRSKKDSGANKPAPAVSSGDKTVDLSGQQLTEIPESVLGQSDITSLNLSNNQLVTLPANINKLTNLQVLNVENNRLVSLPPQIGGLPKLRSADFSNNRLESLPPELGNLTGLQSLNLGGYKGPTNDIDQLKMRLPNVNIKY